MEFPKPSVSKSSAWCRNFTLFFFFFLTVTHSRLHLPLWWVFLPQEGFSPSCWDDCVPGTLRAARSVASLAGRADPMGCVGSIPLGKVGTIFCTASPRALLSPAEAICFASSTQLISAVTKTLSFCTTKAVSRCCIRPGFSALGCRSLLQCWGPADAHGLIVYASEFSWRNSILEE